MMIWLEIWSFVSNFNFDNSFWFWKYPQVTKYSFEICNFSYNLINVLKIDQTILFLFVITIFFYLVNLQVISDKSLILLTFKHLKIEYLNIWKFEHWKILTLEHLDIGTLKHWNIGTLLEHLNIQHSISILWHWNIGTLEHLNI